MSCRSWSRSRRALGGAGLLLALSLLGIPVRTQEPAPLFGPAPAAATASAAARADTLRVRVASLDAARLSPAPLLLNLFDDLVLSASPERMETDRFGHRSWVGQVSGDPLSTVTLTWKDQTVAGTVHTGDAIYRIASAGGIATIAQVDPSAFPMEAQPLLPPPYALAPAAKPEDAAGDRVDVFVYYTEAARRDQGGEEAMEVLVAKAIADTNTALDRSEVPGSVRLVGTGVATGYVEATDSLETDLRALTLADQAATVRNATGADLVALIVSRTVDGACGIGWMGPSPQFAHTVSSATCLVNGQWTLTHELAHNFGSHHNIEDAGAGAFRPYSYGYYDLKARFRTMMSYPTVCFACPRILNYSNPGVKYMGRESGATLANNAHSLTEAFPLVAAFRAEAAGVPGPPGDLRAAVSGSAVVITWTPPASGGTATSYIGYVGSTPGASDVYVGDVGNVTRVVVAAAPMTYFARVRGRNAAGIGPASEEIAITVGQPCVIPSAPVLSGYAAGSTGRIAWNTPAGGPVDHYTVAVGNAPGASNLYSASVGLVNSVSADLPAGTYFVRVAAHAACGSGAPSNEVVLAVP